MSDSFDFDNIGKDAAHNEPPRTSQEAVNETVSNSSVTVLPPNTQEQEEGVKFKFQADFMASSVVEGFCSIWRSLWGSGQGAQLTDKEKEGLNSLLERGAEHFGFVTYISGAKGFFIELLGRLIASIVPRAANKESREHFKKTVFNGSETVKKQEKKSDESVSKDNEQRATKSNGLTASTFSTLRR